MERPQDVREALKEAVKANKENVPAVLDFLVDPFDHYPGFKDFHELLKRGVKSEKQTLSPLLSQ